MSARPPRAIGFDFDHTLGLDHGLERRALYDLAASLGSPLDQDDETRAWIEQLLGEFRSGALSMDAMIARFAERCELGEIDADLWRSTCFALVDESATPIDGAREVLATLRARNVPFAILTNGWSPLQQRKIARALGEGAVETILVSDRLGVVKPQRAAFAALAAAFDCAIDEVWYVGDSPLADIGGALAAGMCAVWFDWEGLVYPDDVPPPTLRIHALRELEELVENALDP
jgi:FMN phosphatase YigB (HAD superfamily)